VLPKLFSSLGCVWGGGGGGGAKTSFLTLYGQVTLKRYQWLPCYCYVVDWRARMKLHQVSPCPFGSERMGSTAAHQ
jgi:hypothetical protein